MGTNADLPNVSSRKLKEVKLCRYCTDAGPETQSEVRETGQVNADLATQQVPNPPRLRAPPFHFLRYH